MGVGVWGRCGSGPHRGKRRRIKVKVHQPGSDGRSVQLEAQGQLFRLRMLYPSPAGKRGLRGKVRQFSRQSRKRMLELLARIDWQRAGFVCFVTLTYPDRNGPPTVGGLGRDAATFLKRIKRRFPKTSAIWRREWQPRKSGQFIGVVFPHLHLMFFSLPFVEHEEVNSTWAEVIGHDDYVRTEIEGIKHWRQAVYYMAKYMAKPVETGSATPEAGPEAASAAPGRPGGEAADGSLVYGTYLTAKGEQESHQEPGIGRSWGVHNRGSLPLAEAYTVNVEPGPWLVEARLLARAYWAGVDQLEGGGYTLFVDEADEVLCQMLAIHSGLRACGGGQ